MSGRIMKPAQIEAESMRIIDGELQKMGITPEHDTAPVIRRVIHTTADFDYADNLFFSADAVKKGIDALRQGASIVTDTNMARVGISQPGLDRLGSRAVCYMADPEVAAEAKRRGVTRASVSVDRMAAEMPGAIFACGNAPTALMALAGHIRSGSRPALVIAVPVGFVNVTEAKEEIISCCGEYEIPVIAARGRKGGSNVAAAVCNALIYMATDMLDPERR